MIYPIYLYGQPVLRKVAKPISKDYPNLSEFISDMYETMYKSEDGIGLAAPQIGKSIRFFVIDLTVLAEDNPEFKDFKKTFINAEIIDRTGDNVTKEEGCLSIPAINENVTRKDKITIRYVDEHFVEHEESYEGFAARVIQHEYDHIEGHVFIDHISPIRKQLIKSKLTRIVKGNVSCRYKYRAV